MLLIFIMLVASTDVCDSAIQQDMNRCALERANRADRSLEDEVRASLAWGTGNAGDGKGVPDGETFDRDGYADVLKSAQRAWLTYRNAQCRLAAYPHQGGSMLPMVEFGCRAEVTEARIAQLKALRE